MLQLNDTEALCKRYVQELMLVWHSINDTPELEEAVKTAAHKCMELYKTHGKGCGKYSSLCRYWLHYQLTFTNYSNDNTKQLWEALASWHQGDITRQKKVVD